MTAIAHSAVLAIILSWGWRRASIALLAGAFGALAMPPFGLFPALAVSLCIAVWLIDGSGGGRRGGATLSAAIAGWWWGFGYFVAGLWWLGSAFLVEADRFAWALPLGVLGLPAMLAFFPALGFALARALWSPSAWRILALAAGLSLSEWLRGHLFTGFPWNVLGMALAQNVWTMQIASAIGLYGMTLFAIAIAAAPATIGTGKTPAGRGLPSLFALVALGSLAAFGLARIPSTPSPEFAEVRLRIMQPNLPQDAKFNPDNREAIMQRYLGLSDRATSPETSGIEDVTHLVWPESAFPFLLHRDARALAQIAALLPPRVTLITGAARMEEPLFDASPSFYNSIHAIESDGTIIGTYDKVHLVPFGEYFPHMFDFALRSIGLREFINIPGGFQPGSRRTLLNVPGLPPIAAGICYEAIFPGAMTPRESAAGVILNVTNDAWFGDTPGPRQHFAQARLRSVEQGLALVRAANTGISAVVDPYGRVVASLPVGIEGVIDSGLPVAIGATIYSRFGNSIFWLQLVFCLIASFVFRARRTI